LHKIKYFTKVNNSLKAILPRIGESAKLIATKHLLLAKTLPEASKYELSVALNFIFQYKR